MIAAATMILDLRCDGGRGLTASGRYRGVLRRS